MTSRQKRQSHREPHEQYQNDRNSLPSPDRPECEEGGNEHTHAYDRKEGDQARISFLPILDIPHNRQVQGQVHQHHNVNRQADNTNLEKEHVLHRMFPSHSEEIGLVKDKP